MNTVVGANYMGGKRFDSLVSRCRCPTTQSLETPHEPSQKTSLDAHKDATSGNSVLPLLYVGRRKTVFIPATQLSRPLCQRSRSRMHVAVFARTPVLPAPKKFSAGGTDYTHRFWRAIRHSAANHQKFLVLLTLQIVCMVFSLSSVR